MARTSTRRLMVALASGTLLASLSVGSVMAGEITGNGEPTPVAGFVARSICSFSGYNDGEPPPGRTAAHVQSWGQIPKVVRDEIALHGEHPGDACNGHTGFLAGGGGE